MGERNHGRGRIRRHRVCIPVSVDRIAFVVVPRTVPEQRDLLRHGRRRTLAVAGGGVVLRTHSQEAAAGSPAEPRVHSRPALAAVRRTRGRGVQKRRVRGDRERLRWRGRGRGHSSSKGRRESYLVQCKNWRKQRIGVATVREMYGVLMAESAWEVFVVCSGTFTADAVRFAEGKPINLVDGDQLMEMVARVRQDESNVMHASSAHQEPLDANARGQEPDGRESIHPGAPSCPRCGGNLVVRTARNGKNAGRRFWGCETFPQCRFIEDYPDSAT